MILSQLTQALARVLPEAFRLLSDFYDWDVTRLATTYLDPDESGNESESDGSLEVTIDE